MILTIRFTAHLLYKNNEILQKNKIYSRSINTKIVNTYYLYWETYHALTNLYIYLILINLENGIYIFMGQA